VRVQLQTPRRYVTGKGAPLHLRWGTEFIRMVWRAEKCLAAVSNQNPIPRPSIPRIVTKPTDLSRLHYLHASPADVSLTINCLTRSLVLPHNHRANTAQFVPERTHFNAPKFFVLEAVHFSNVFSVVPLI
jgi:hypothetical protein